MMPFEDERGITLFEVMLNITFTSILLLMIYPPIYSVVSRINTIESEEEAKQELNWIFSISLNLIEWVNREGYQIQLLEEGDGFSIWIREQLVLQKEGNDLTINVMAFIENEINLPIRYFMKNIEMFEIKSMNSHTISLFVSSTVGPSQMRIIEVFGGIV